MAYLYQIRADGTQIERWEVGTRPLVVGRGDCADACIEDDALSRSHFLVVSEGTEFFLVDLNSSNGTWMNDKRLSAHRLRPNELFMAGESLFYFALEPVATFPVPSPAILLASAAANRPQVRPG